MEKKRLMALCGGICLFLVLVASPFMAVSNAAAQKPITLKAVSFLPTFLATVSKFTDYTKLVAKRSKGQLTIKWLGGPEIMKGKSQPEAVSTGLIDISLLPFNWFEPKDPSARVITMSEWTPWEERKVGFYDYLQKIAKEKMNLHLIGRINPNRPFYMFTNFKPVNPKKDFKGKKIGFDGPEWASTFKALGASLVTVSVPEWYTALERGVTDAQMAPMTFVKNQSFFEVSKYIVDYPIAPANNVVAVVNLDKWKSLPPDMRDLMDKAWAELEPMFYDFQTKQAAASRQLATEKKMGFIKFSGAGEKWFLDVFDRTQWDILLEKGVPRKTWDMLKDLAKKP